MTTFVPGTLEKDLRKYAMSLQQIGPSLDTANTNISTNTTNIATNTTNITSNTSAITSLQTAGQGLTNVSGSLAVSLSKITNSISGDVSLNNTANYFDGPSVAQGTSGTWFASGTVTVTDTSVARIFAKLWDGTTVIASAEQRIDTAGGIYCLSLSGFISSPAGNIKISCRDVTNTTGKILANDTTNAKDSTISAIRIA